MDHFRDEKGASARQLVLMFLAAVAVCAVFFSLGFVVGYNHAPSKAVPVTENVSDAGDIPPTINPPAGSSSQSSSDGMETEKVSPESTSIPQPEHPAPLRPEPASATQSKAPKAPPKKAAAKKVAESKPASAPRKPPSSTASSSSDLHFAVQVMASRTKADAGNLVKLLKSHGYPAYVLNPRKAHAKDHLFRVQVGPFASRATADVTRDKLVGEGFRPFVVHF